MKDSRASMIDLGWRSSRAWQVLIYAILGNLLGVAVAQQIPANLAAAKSAMSDGLNAMQRNNLAEAQRDFSRVVKLAPQIEPGHAALGSVLLALNQYEGSIRELEIAHHLAPSDLAVDANLGRAQAALHLYEAASASFRECVTASKPLELSPEETLAYATALSATNQFSAATDLLQHVLQQNPNSASLNDSLGALLAQSGHMQQALPHFERAVSIDPSLALSQLHLATTLLALDRPQDALAPAELAATAMPADFNAQLQLGRALSANHRDAGALEHLRRAADLRTPRQPTDAVYALGLALQASGDSQSALPIFAAAVASTAPGATFDRTSALINYALARVQTGDAVGALPLYAEALAAGPDSPTLREDFGAAYLQQADLDHAVEQFKMGLALDPRNAHLHYDLGLAFKLKDNLVAAVPEFEHAALLDPNLPDPAYTLGVIYMQQGRYPEAIASLQRATRLQPSNGDAWALLGGVLKDSGDATEATAALHHAIELEPDQPSLHIQLATLDTQAGRTAEATAERKIAADLSRAALSHQRADFALKSGRTLLAQNKLPEAIFQLTTAASADPALVEPHQLLSEAYLRQGKPAEAALERRQALALASSTHHP